MLFTDRERGSGELIGEMSASAREVFDDVIEQVEQLQSHLVDLEAFVVERHGDGRRSGAG